jgi:apolipoprotein D and lipocalin family protein
MKKMTQKTLILLTMCTMISCNTVQDLPTVEKVDLQQYSGKWYEIARLPNSFEKGLECVTATYTLKSNGKVEVLNKGYTMGSGGKIKSAGGTARIPDPEFPGRLKVTFFWPFYGDYYILVLDENYSYALIGAPSRKYLWVLSRTRLLDEAIYSRLMDHAGKNGFNIDHVIQINQSCE